MKRVVVTVQIPTHPVNGKKNNPDKFTIGAIEWKSF